MTVDRLVLTGKQGGASSRQLDSSQNSQSNFIQDVNNNNIAQGVSFDDLPKELCLVEQDLFARIHAKEYIKQRWTKKNKDVDSPHIMDVLKWFNLVKQ